MIHIVEAQNLPHVIALEVDNKYSDCLCAWGKMGNVIGNWAKPDDSVKNKRVSIWYDTGSKGKSSDKDLLVWPI